MTVRCGRRTAAGDPPARTGDRCCGPRPAAGDPPVACGRHQHRHRLVAHRNAGEPAERRASSTLNRVGVHHSVALGGPRLTALGATDPRWRPSSADPTTLAPAATDHQMARGRDACSRSRRRFGPWRIGCSLRSGYHPSEEAGRQRGRTAMRIRHLEAVTSAGPARRPFPRAPATRCCAMADRPCRRARYHPTRHGGAATMTRDDPIEARPGTLGPATRKNDESPRLAGALYEESGGVLLSQGVYPQVPLALAGLTAVFGMGTGVTPPLWPPEISCQRGSPRGLQSKHERSSNQALGRLVPVG